MRGQQAGFTAVEVLVTLFIAAIFIGGAHMVYGMVLNNSTESREAAVASNYAYRLVQHYAHQASSGKCSDHIVTNYNAAGVLSGTSGLSSPQFRVTINCPYGSATSLKRITANITYNVKNGTKRISHAIIAR